MRKLLTAGIFGTILSLTGANYAGASIISRGFFDEAMENYATNTALDLKANQTDLTALSNKIGNDWPFNSDMMAGLHYLVSEFYPPEISLKNTSDLAHFLFGGALESGLYRNAAGVLNFLGEKIINVGDYEFLSGKVLDGFRSLTQLTNGWTSTDGTTYLGVKDLNTKTGSYYWGPENDRYKFSNIPYFEELFPGTSPDKNIAMNDMANTILSNYTDPGFPGLAGVTNQLLNGWTDANGVLANPGLKGMHNGWTDSNKATYSGLNTISQDYTYILDTFGTSGLFSLFMKGGTTTFPGLPTNTILSLPELSYGVSKIGILPSGSLLNQTPFTNVLYSFTQGTDSPVYPNTMADLVKQIYGEFSSSGNQPGLVHLLITGFPHEGSLPVNSNEIGILPAMSLAETANETANAAKSTAQANAVKIGDLPSGQFHIRLPYLSIFESAGIAEPYNYPTSLSDLFLYLFGSNEDTTKDGLFPVIGIRLNNISAQINNINNTSNAIQSKIGTLPDGYDSVGAALTAMKSDIDAKNLPSTSDDGQYVLTAKKVGDTITYTWVKMDLTNEEQAQ